MQGGSLKTSVEKIDAHTIKLAVCVPPDDVDKAIDVAYKRLAKQMKIPGFRKGKAPKPVLDNQVGREAIVADAQDDVLSDSYSRALDTEGIRPIAQPEIDDLEPMVAGSEFEYTAIVQVRPELELSSVEGLTVEVPPREVTQREIDAQIDQMREKFATLEPADRGVAEDDFVLVSFVGRVDGEDYEGNAVDKYLYEMGRGLMPDEFERGIIGLEPGEETHIEFVIPETSSVPEFVGKTATFDVTVHEIKAKVLPELDDEFAANAGGYDNVEEMRESIREQFARNREAAYERLRERGARRALADRLEGEVPEKMIENMREQIGRDFFAGLESRGVSVEQYLQATGITPEQLDSDFGKQAEEAATEELALEALFRKLEMEVTEEDVDATILEMAGAVDADAAELRAKWDGAGVISVLKEQIMHRRAVQWLMDEANVEVIEKEPSDEDATDAEDLEE